MLGGAEAGRIGMARQRMAIVGRAEEEAVLDSALQGIRETGRLVLVRGADGIGKSTLLRAAADNWRRSGVRVVTVDWGAGRDRLGAEALLDAIRDQFHRVGADGSAIEPVSRLSQAVDRHKREGAASLGALLQVVTELSRLSEALAAVAPTVLVVDDAHTMPEPTLALRAAAQSGCLVVAAVAEDRCAGALPRIANTVIDLPALSSAAVAAMLRQHYRSPIDEGLLAALHLGLGTFAGHPATVLSTMDGLDRCQRLARPRTGSNRHICLVEPQRPIMLAGNHPLVTRLQAVGTLAQRVAMAAAVLRLHVHDIALLADATGGDEDEYGDMADTLVAHGILVEADGGRLDPVCAALGERLVHDAGPQAVGRLHRACAAATLRRMSDGYPSDRTALADHLAAARHTLPSDQRTASALTAIAADAGQTQPERAATWLRAALCHASASDTTNEILDRLLRLLVQTGRYEPLGEVVEAVTARVGVDAYSALQQTDLASAAALAAVHVGVPLHPSTDQLLRNVSAETCDRLDLAAWWFRPTQPVPMSTRPRSAGGRGGALRATSTPLVEQHELSLVWLSMRLRRPDLWDRTPAASDDLLVAGSFADLVTVFAHVLESRYGEPESGLLAAHHRLVACYRRGDFGPMLSAAREVELVEPTVTPAHQVARALAAEAHGLRGELAQARSCQAAISDAAPFRGLRWLAEESAGTKARPESDQIALHRGAAVLADQPGGGLGTELVLTRMAELAAGSEHPRAKDLLLQSHAAATKDDQRVTRSVATLVEAVVEGDPALAATSAEEARAAGDLPRLVSAALITAMLPASGGRGSPHVWLGQAYQAAWRMEAPSLRARITSLMRRHGIAPPRTRPPRAVLSTTEREIINLIRQGWTNRQIAAHVRMSEKTVETYLTRLFARTGLKSRVELATVSLNWPG
jgi:DNA-binding CsgD family transcriptional regulator